MPICDIMHLKGVKYMKAISADVRRIIVAAKLRKEPSKVITLWTGVPKSTIDDVWRLYRETLGVQTKPRPGRPGRLIEADFIAIKELIESERDITLEEIVERLDLPIKKSRLSEIIIEMGFSFKKRRFTQKSS